MGFTLTKKRFLIWKTVMMVVAGLVLEELIFTT